MDDKTIDEMAAEHAAFCSKQLKLPKDQRKGDSEGVAYMNCKECGKAFSYVDDGEYLADGMCSPACGVASLM